jgi:hypothetical protein
VALEGLGVPSVVIGTDAFTSLARATSAAEGMPHLAHFTVAHPIGGVDPARVRSRADALVADVLGALTRDRAPAVATGAGACGPVTAPDDLDELQQFVMARGWGDGLPVLPPTSERVARLLSGWTGARDDLVATLAPRFGLATVEAIAVNAALAGAGPEHMPVIVAAVKAASDPAFNLQGVLPTTHPCTPLVIVNGPIAGRLGVNAGANALGQGHRANAVIGRALRLVLQNVAGATPGHGDRATLGHPGKYSYCVAENEAASPWEPLHVERGFAADASCVTVCAGEAPHNVNDHGSTTPEGLLTALAGTAAITGSNNIYLAGEPLVILGPEHAATIAAAGWSKADFKRALWERARVRLGRFSPENLARFAVIDPARFRDRSPDDDVAIALTPDNIMVIVAGGPGKHSVIVPTFGATRSVTVRI